MDQPQLPAGVSEDDLVVLFDGECVLCNGWAHFLIERDRKGRLKLGTVQSEVGRALLGRAGLSTDDFDTMLFVERGRSHVRSTAFLHVLRHLPAPWSWLFVFRFVPRPIRDFLYGRLAKNRYRLFGRKEELCLRPSPELRTRLID